MTPIEVFVTYLAVKNHFTKPNYDYQKYQGKVKTTQETFYKKKERFFYERLSRQKSDAEILDFFVANFVECNDSQSLWIGEIVKEGEHLYQNWMSKKKNRIDIFTKEIQKIFDSKQFDEIFRIKSNKHPQLLKEYLQGKLSIESLIILDRILNYKKDFDKKLNDPIWESISMKMSKYSSFLHTDVFRYKKILKECVL
jgi:mevalonate pyrophosphate decarboxylase